MEPTAASSPATGGEPAGMGADAGIRGPVVSTPETCGGKPGIAGGRIRVKHVAVMHRRRGMGPEATVPEYPHLSPAAVHAALAYDHDRRDARDAEIEAERAWYEAMRASRPSKLHERPAAREADAPDDPVPSR